jgi:NAD+ synthase (glutamine-hydrolysing)
MGGNQTIYGLDTDPKPLRVALAQVDCVPGDVPANLDTCLAAVDAACAQGANLVVLPELALTGMLVERFASVAALRPDAPLLEAIRERSRDVSIVIGFLEDAGGGRIHNATGYFEQGKLLHVHRKVYLTGYGMLSGERGTLAPGEGIASFTTRFGQMAIVICDDAWHMSLPYLAAMDGAEVLLTCAGSPRGNASSSCTSEELWIAVNRAYAVMLKTVNVFVNRVGLEGELSFWGGSHAIAPDGRTLVRISHDRPDVAVVELDLREVARERRAYPYLSDERLELTLRELRRVVGAAPRRRESVRS